jgi:hypothetical protein
VKRSGRRISGSVEYEMLRPVLRALDERRAWRSGVRDQLLPNMRSGYQMGSLAAWQPLLVPSPLSDQPPGPPRDLRFFLREPVLARALRWPDPFWWRTRGAVLIRAALAEAGRAP